MTDITTAAELDVLPVGSIVFDADEDTLIKDSRGRWVYPSTYLAGEGESAPCWLPAILLAAAEPATVKPSEDQIANAIAFASGPMGTHYYDYALKAARAVLALPPGRTEAKVLRDAANRLGDEAASSDYLANHVSDHGLEWIVRKLREYADEREG